MTAARSTTPHGACGNAGSTRPFATWLRWILAAVCVLVVPPATGADEADPRSFEPGDISIGEPLPLPFAPPVTRAAEPPPAAAPAPPASSPPPSGGVGPTGGWLGLSVAESTAPGRWLIASVVPAGPAAAAGILPGDEIRAIEGKLLESADDVSQALTSISQGQPVRLTTARSDQVTDVVVTAGPRPSAAATRDWRGSANAEPSPSATVSAPAVSAPPPAAAPVASVLAAPPPASGAPASLPLPVPGPRPGLPVAAMPAATANAPSAAGKSLAAGTATSLPSPRGRTALGVRTVPIDPGVQARFRLGAAGGAYVIGVVEDLPASKAGIPPGSVIVSLDDRPVRSPQDLTRLVTAGPVDRPVSLHYVLPGGAEKRADVVLQSLELPLEQVLVGPPGLSPTEPPALQTGPALRAAHRVPGEHGSDVAVLREEISLLRSRLELLERRLEQSRERP